MSNKKIRETDQRFVLFAVLVAVLAISALAVSTAGWMTADAGALTVEANIIESCSAAEAGLVRSFASFEDRDDVLGLTPYKPEVQWTFQGVSVRLRMRAESGKLDVLYADPKWVEFVVRAMIEDDQLQRQILDRIAAMRKTNALPYDLAAILPASARVTNQAHVLDDFLTIFSAQNGIDPLAAAPLVRNAIIQNRPDLKEAMDQSGKAGRITPDLAAGLGPIIVQPRPLYTVEAQAQLPNGIRCREAALVFAQMNGGEVRIERQYALPPN
jgi:hypothetical protein